MQKAQWIVIGAGVLLSAGLYMLPKTVVKNERPAAAETQNNATDKDTLHKAQLPDALKNELRDLRTRYQMAAGQAAKKKALDTLVMFFKEQNLFDSVAIYTELYAGLTPSIETDQLIGDTYFDLFNFELEEGRIGKWAEKVREYYTRVLRADSNRQEVKARMAMTYVGGDEPMKPVLMLREVLEKDPKNITALYFLGDLSFRSNQLDKAVERFKQVLEVNNKHVQAWFYLGICYATLNDNEAARQCFKTVKDLNPDPAILAEADKYLSRMGK